MAIQPSVYIYEDSLWRNFRPLTDVRPVWDLRCGALTLAQRLRHLFPGSEVYCVARPEVMGVCESAADQTAIPKPAPRQTLLLVNGRTRLSEEDARSLANATGSALFRSGDEVIALRWSEATALPKEFDPLKPESWQKGELKKLPSKEIQAKSFQFLWELVEAAGGQLADDMRLTAVSRASPPEFPADVIVRRRQAVDCAAGVQFAPGAILDAGPNPIRLDEEADIGAGVILDSRAGPIWLARGVVVEAGAILQGPLYIGEQSIVRAGARISGGCSFGPQTRVGGEINKSIIQGCTNKQHSGYLGASYLGSWVNFGAATDVSDLKNNYQPITVAVDGRMVNSGHQHVGVFVGDWTRTAIHTRLNSGSVIGVGCNILTAEFPPREVPPFVWLAQDGAQEYRLDKALVTIQVVMSRRGKTLNPDMEAMLRRLHRESAAERDNFLKSQA